MQLATHTPSLTRLFWIAIIALASHLAVMLVRAISRRLLSSRLGSEAKAQTLTGFGASLLIFVLYFGAAGFALNELGVSLTTYLASASVIGLAVSFGSQGVVEDVITGLTVVFSDLLDVGDMANLGGQIGVVEHVGMRFTTLVGFSGERVSVPNRTIGSVVNYPRRYVDAYVDARLHTGDDDAIQRAAEALRRIASAAYEQYAGVMVTAPTLEGFQQTNGGYGYLRLRLCIWPGQGSVIEGPVKSALVRALQPIEAGYADWMVSVYYHAEPISIEPRQARKKRTSWRAAR